MNKLNKWIIVSILFNLITIVGIIFVVVLDWSYFFAIIPAIPTMFLNIIVKKQMKNKRNE